MSRRQAERKSNQERVRRNHLKEAIEVLHNTLLENDDGFHQEALRRSSAEGLRATRTATSVLNATRHLSFTKVEIINQAIHSIRAAIAKNERLRNQEKDDDPELRIPSPPSSPLPDDSVQANKPESAGRLGVGVATTGTPAVASDEEESSHRHEHHQPRKTPPLVAVVNNAPEPEPSQLGNVSHSQNQEDIDQKRAANSQRFHDHSATHGHLGALLQHPIILSHNGQARLQDGFHVHQHQQRAAISLNLSNNISPTDVSFPVHSSTVAGYHNLVAHVALPYFEIGRSIDCPPSQDPVQAPSQYALPRHNQLQDERENLNLSTIVSSTDALLPSFNSAVLGYHNPASTQAPVSLPHFEERNNGRRPAPVDTFAIDLPSLVRKFAAQRALAPAIPPSAGEAEVLSRTPDEITPDIWQSDEGRDTKRRKAE